MRLLDLEIHAWLARYLRGGTLEEFEDWFVPETWQVERSGNAAAVELADVIRPALAEVSAGEMTEDEFKALAASLEARRTERIRFFQAAIAPDEERLRETIELTAPAAS